MIVSMNHTIKNYLFIIATLFSILPICTSANIYIDQKDKRFYSFGLIPEDRSSSLCGPTSFLNLLLSDLYDSDQNNIESGIDFSKKITETLIQKTINNSKGLLLEDKIDVNNGLQEYELIKYIERFQKTEILDFKSISLYRTYRNYGESFFAERLELKKFASLANNPEKQIWLIKFQELRVTPPPFSKKPPHLDFDPGLGDDVPSRFFHFVTKIKTNDENSFELIDPENPNDILKLELSLENDPVTKKTIKILRPKSNNAFKNFSIRPPYRIELISIIAG